jgi:hypothetical protein
MNVFLLKCLGTCFLFSANFLLFWSRVIFFKLVLSDEVVAHCGRVKKERKRERERETRYSRNELL